MKRNVVRVAGIIGFAVLLFIVFFYVIPIYNFKNADAHIREITHVIANGPQERLNDELNSRNRMKLVSDAQIQDFVRFVNASKINETKGKLWSSDDIIISVSADSSEAILVLSQRGILSQWQVVNVRYLKNWGPFLKNWSL